MTRLSVVIITRNEEKNLPRAMASVSFADEVIVVDSQSTDRTREIAVELGAKIYSPEWQGFGHAKQTGLDHATGEWVLSLDADEEVSDELAAEIKNVLESDTNSDGYEMPRRTQFLGRWIYHCGWYPDPVLRLFRKEAGVFTDAAVHEKVEVNGPVGRLRGELLHYSYPTLESYLEKFNRYTSLAAEEGIRNGRRVRWFDIIARPFAAFVKHYALKRGFLDGYEGLLISVLSSGYVMVKYAKMRDLARREKGLDNSE